MFKDIFVRRIENVSAIIFVSYNISEHSKKKIDYFSKGQFSLPSCFRVEDAKESVGIVKSPSIASYMQMQTLPQHLEEVSL